jgi:8-oxo-dGTP diphosphatase
MSDNIPSDSEKLAEGQQVITACALVHDSMNNAKKVFLAKRADTKKFLPGVYEIPGGHIDYGEGLIEGLKREFKEEFGADIIVGDPFAAFTYVNDVKKSHSVEIVYFARLAPGSKISLDPSDHSACKWVSENELESIYSDLKSKDDDEFVVLRKGLAILNGKSLDLG